MIKEFRSFDDFEAVCYDAEEFLNLLKEREENTERYVIPAKDLKFYPIEKRVGYYGTDEKLCQRLGVPVELLEDTKKNTDIIVSWHKNQQYLLGKSAWISLKNRIDIYGRGIDLIGTELQTQVLNKRFSQIGDRVKVIVVDSKVRAIMSDMYAVIPACNVFKGVLDHIEERFGGYNFIVGYVDHNIVYCKVLLPTIADELNKLYRIPLGDFIPGIVITTSDTGFSANRIGPYWQDKSGYRKFINSDEYIYMEHRGSNNLDKLMQELPNIFSKYQNIVKRFAQLLTIEIKNPIKVLRKACSKKLGLPKKLTKALIEQFEQHYAQKTVTAYDICREILYVPSLCSNCSIDLEEKVGKAININYLDLDDDNDN